MKLNKKGQLGLDTVKVVMITFMVMAVIAVAIILATSAVRDVADKTNTLTGESKNTTVNLTDSRALTEVTLKRNALIRLSTVIVTNVTTNAHIPTTNYTITSTGYISPKDLFTQSGVNATNVNVSFTYDYPNPQQTAIVDNVSSGVTGFFSNTGTIFAILVAVVIILAIAIIIAVVSRFGSGGGLGGSRKEYGSGTLMGV